MTADAPRLVRFVEPTEGSFSLLLPAGWRAQAGVTRAPGAAPRPWYRVLSPGGGAELRSADPRIPPSFVDPRFHPMGMLPMLGGAPRPYLPPAHFAEEYARQFARERGASSFAVTAARDVAAIFRDDPRPEVQARARLLLQQGAELAGLAFACPDRGLSGLVDVFILRMMMPTGLAWMPFLTALAGPTDAWPHVKATLLQIARTREESAAWQQAQANLQQAQHQMAMDTIATGTRVMQVQAQSGMDAIAAHAHRAHLAAQASAEASAAQSQAWQAQQAAGDERQRRAVNAVRGTVDLHDPATGQVYRGAPAGYATYWTDGAERVAASAGHDNPDPAHLTQAEDLDDRRGPLSR